MLERHHVNVDGSQIFVIESVPATRSTAPSVVFVPGLGGTALGWVPVLRLAPAGLRLFTYDRLGTSHSDKTTLPRQAAVLAQELKATLLAAQVPGPYVIVLSSYAGIIGREFLEAYDSDVAGMIYVDANQEKSQQARQWPLEASSRVASELFGTLGDTGLAEAHKCTAEEWADLQAEEQRMKTIAAESDTKTGGAAEWELYESSLVALGKHAQFDRQALGTRPLSVIQANLVRDFRRAYDAGRAAGRGSADDHKRLDDFCKRLPEVELRMNAEVLKLSSTHRMVTSSATGHMVSLWEPELVVQELQWCLDKLKRD